MSGLRAQTIAARKISGTRERYVVNDDGAPPAELAPAGFTFLVVLGAADALTAPMAERWPPTAQVLLSTALALLVAALFGLVIVGRCVWRLMRAIGPPLMSALVHALALAISAPFRFVFGIPPKPARPKRRGWWPKL